MRRLAALAVVAVLLGGGVGVLAPSLFERERRPVWTEAPWTLANDPWGRGRAFACGASACGGDIRVYVRPKLGACNCMTGIASDEDLDRMGDVALVGEGTALGPGRAVTVGWMSGRARGYAVDAGTSVLSVAFNDRCDMVVATALLPRGGAAMLEPEVLAFLNSETILGWTKLELGI
jgi:hypothetical protein